MQNWYCRFHYAVPSNLFHLTGLWLWSQILTQSLLIDRHRNLIFVALYFQSPSFKSTNGCQTRHSTPQATPIQWIFHVMLFVSCQRRRDAQLNKFTFVHLIGTFSTSNGFNCLAIATRLIVDNCDTKENQQEKGQWADSFWHWPEWTPRFSRGEYLYL